MMDEDEAQAMLLGAGNMQRVDGLTPEAFEKALAYHTKSQTHMWTSLVQYLHSEEAIKAAFGDNPELLHMDRENLIGHHIGCYICEEPANKRIITRACKGQPKGTLSYR